MTRWALILLGIRTHVLMPSMSGVTLTLLLALLAAPSAALLAAPQSPHAPTLQLRGGVGGVDPVVVAKIATGLEMAHSSFTVLAPEKAGEAYGLQGMSALTTWIVEGIGMQNLARAVFAANMLRGCALPRAMAWSLVPQLVGNLQDVLQVNRSLNPLNPKPPKASSPKP
ncbi:hypothetical protein T484DRAFT_2390589 [Baffinella frigidus]|nr:hypothetical protein T484DRAFT_2390589 [Cryptophyta sp. CCMP2293]